MTRAAAALLALGLLLTGCSDAPSTASPESSGAAPSTAAPDAGSTQAPAGQGTLLLRGDGLALQTPEGLQMIPFGSGTSVVAPALAASLGEPAPLAVECGQGIRDTLGVEGFDVLFNEDEFVGWDDASGTVATEEGLKVGSTRAEVQAALPDASFTTSTLGPEFTSTSGLGGFLDGEAPTSTVVGLTGGESCVVR